MFFAVLFKRPPAARSPDDRAGQAEADEGAQTPPTRPPTLLVSPEVHADGRVTFCFRDPKAAKVEV